MRLQRRDAASARLGGNAASRQPTLHHLIAELGLTSNHSAAARRDAPDSTASTTRSRNSKEHGFGIDPPSKIRIDAASVDHQSPPGNPDSTQPKSALTNTIYRQSVLLGKRAL